MAFPWLAFKREDWRQSDRSWSWFFGFVTMMSDDAYSHGSHGRSYSHNSTITTSVSIRVTPSHDFILSWSFLWAGFVLTSLVAAYQVWKEQRLLTNNNRADDIENGRTGASAEDGASSADVTRSMVRVYKSWVY